MDTFAVPVGHVQQILRGRAGEGVDRLVVVADDAEIAPFAHPQVQQRRLQQVDVLELVDGERVIALAERRGDDVVLLEHADGQLEHVLEVDGVATALVVLVARVRPLHEVGRDRRRVLAERGEVPLRRDALVLRPLDLAGDVDHGNEPVGLGKGASEGAEDLSLGRQHAPDLVGPEEPELLERRGVERPGMHALDLKPGEAVAHLAGRLLGERDRQQRLRREGAGLDLVGEPAGDRRRLARAGPREDAHGSRRGLDRPFLMRVQPLEDAGHPRLTPAAWVPVRSRTRAG